MPLVHETKVFGVIDAKIYKMLTDPAAAPTTYGSGVNVPGMKSMAVSKVYNSKELRGDNALLDTESVLERVTLKIAFAKLAFDVESIITGGTVADTGVTPNMKATLTTDTADVINFWKLEAQCVRADSIGGDVHIVAYKCKISASLDMGMAEEDYQLFGFEATSVKTNGTGAGWLQEVYNETAVAVP